MEITIYYATTTGKTEDIAQRLAAQLGSGVVIKDVDGIGAAEDLCRGDVMICCTPTWNTGADSSRSGTAWDGLIDDIAGLTMAGKVVAIVGLGDSSSYSDYFCDAMEELYSAFRQAGARMVGMVDIDGYTFNASKSLINGKLCGLAIDEDSEPDLTDERINAWVAQLRREVGAVPTAG